MTEKKLVVHYINDGTTCAQRTYDLLRGRKARHTTTDHGAVTCKHCRKRFGLDNKPQNLNQTKEEAPRGWCTIFV